MRFTNIVLTCWQAIKGRQRLKTAFKKDGNFLQIRLLKVEPDLRLRNFSRTERKSVSGNVENCVTLLQISYKRISPRPD